MNSNKNIKKGALISYFSIGISIIAGIIYTPWMIREIGQNDYGLFSLALSIISYLTMDFGLSSAVSRFLSKYNAEDNKEDIANFLGMIYRLFFYISIAIFIIIVIIYFFIDVFFLKFSPAEIEKFKTIYIILGFYSLLIFPFKPLDGILTANEYFFELKLFTFIQKILTILLMVIFLFLGYKLFALVIINAVSGIFVTLLKIIFVRRKSSSKINFKYKNQKLLKNTLFFSFWAFIISLIGNLAESFSPTILGISSGAYEISIYSIGATFYGYSYSIANALSGLFLPKVTNIIYRNKDEKRLQNLYIKIGRIQFLILGLILIGFSLVGKEFIGIWMKDLNFQKSYLVALFLIIPTLFVYSQSIANTALYSKNLVKHIAIGEIIKTIVSIVIALFLSPNYGAIGASIGLLFGNIIGRVLYLNIIYKKILKLNTYEFYNKTLISFLIPFISIFFISKVLISYIPTNSYDFFIIKVFIILIIYIFVCWFFILNNEEKELIKKQIVYFIKK